MPHMRGKPKVKGPAQKKALHSRSELVWNPHDLGGYRWPPTYSNWLKTVFWKFTIFSSFSVPKLLGPL
jgi:hypothetical protein